MVNFLNLKNCDPILSCSCFYVFHSNPVSIITGSCFLLCKYNTCWFNRIRMYVVFASSVAQSRMFSVNVVCFLRPAKKLRGLGNEIPSPRGLSCEPLRFPPRALVLSAVCFFAYSHVAFFQRYSSGPCLWLFIHHLQNANCRTKIIAPTIMLAVMPRSSWRLNPQW